MENKEKVYFQKTKFKSGDVKCHHDCPYCKRNNSVFLSGKQIVRTYTCKHFFTIENTQMIFVKMKTPRKAPAVKKDPVEETLFGEIDMSPRPKDPNIRL